MYVQITNLETVSINSQQCVRNVHQYIALQMSLDYFILN